MGNGIPEKSTHRNGLSKFKWLVGEVLGLVFSREKQKGLMGISLYRNALFLVVTNMAVPVTSFFFWIIVARFYSTGDVGLASATASIVALLGLLSTIGFEFGLVRYLANAGQNANRMVNTSLTIGSIAALIFSGIFLGGLSFFSPALLPLRQNPVYSLVFVILALASTATILLANTFIARRQAVFTMLSSLISSMVRLPLPILFVLFIPSFIGINLALCAALVVAVFISLLFFVPKTLPGFRPVPTISRPIIRGMLHFSFTNYIANALMAFTIYVIPLMVINLLSAEANAYFYISWTIGGVLSTISSGTTASLFAEGAFNETKFVADIWRSLKMTYILLIPAALIVFLLANRLLLLFGRDYSIQGTTLFRTMVLAALVVSLNGIFMSVLRVKKRIATLILMVAVIAVVTITTSYLLLPHIGINAPGIGWLAGQSIVAVYVAFKLLKLAKTGQI